MSMNLLNLKMQEEDRQRQSPVIGKISIGVPTEEMVLIDHAEGLKLRRDMRLKTGKSILKGTPLEARHLKALRESGYEEVPILRGAAPGRLDHFRILRRARSTGQGYVHDPALYEALGLPDEPREIPIMVTTENLEKVIQTHMLNWDRENNCAFCFSSDGRTAKRRLYDEENNVTEKFEEVECVPFFDDPRVKSNESPICPYRKVDQNMGKPCDYRGKVYVQILTNNPDAGMELGRLFVLETTSYPSSRHWLKGIMEALNDPKLGRLSFIPLKLAIIKERTGTQGGTKQKKDVWRTTISIDQSYLETYRPAIDRLLQVLKEYRSQNDFILGREPAADPTDIPVLSETDDELRVWQAEFAPHIAQKALKDEGLITDEEIAEAQRVDDEDGIFVRAASHTASSLRRRELLNRARRMPPENYRKFYEHMDSITEQNLSLWSKRVDGYLAPLSEGEMSANYDLNVAQEQEAAAA
jgi:hypothetical protein